MWSTSTFDDTNQRTKSLRTITATMSDTCVATIQNMRASPQLRLSCASAQHPSDVTKSRHSIHNESCATALLSVLNVRSNDDVFADHALRGKQAQKLGNFNEALNYFQRALLSKRETIDTEAIEIQEEYGNILFNAGLIYMTEFKSFALSVQAFEQCLEVQRYCLGSFHLDVSATLYCLGRINLVSGDDTYYAYTLLNESLSILLNEHPTNTNSIIAVWEELARAQVAVGEIDDAESSIAEIRKLKARAAPFV